MKKYYLGIFSVILTLLSLDLSAQNETVLTAARLQLATSLAKIPIGQEKNYGFESRAEFTFATIGKPIQVVTLQKEFYDNPQQNTIVSLNEWRVPVLVNGQTRVLFTVYNNGTNWEVADIGGALLGTEIQQKLLQPEHFDAYILRLFPLYADFLIKAPSNGTFENAAYIPLTPSIYETESFQQLGKTELTKTEAFILLSKLNSKKNN